MRLMKRHFCLVLLGVVAFAFISPNLTLAQEKPANYPERPIEMVVGYGPGGGSDVFARTICIPMRKYIRDVPIVIVNKPGAGGAVAFEYIYSQPADGYTILAGSVMALVSDNLVGTTKYNYTDFRPIIRCQYDVTMLAVKGDGGKYKDIHAIMADAKERPGQVALGVVGNTQFWTVTIGQFAEPAGVQFKIVSFDRAGKLYASVLGGHIDGMLDEPASMVELFKAKKLKPLLTFTENRLEGFEDVPTTKEFGRDAFLSVYRGAAVKKGTPEPIVQYLHSVFKKAYESDFYQNYQKFSYMDLRPGYLGPDDFYKFMEGQYKILYKEFKKRDYLSDNVRLRYD